MKADSITLYTMDGGVEEPKMLHVDWDTTAAQKADMISLCRRDL